MPVRCVAGRRREGERGRGGGRLLDKGEKGKRKGESARGKRGVKSAVTADDRGRRMSREQKGQSESERSVRVRVRVDADLI